MKKVNFMDDFVKIVEQDGSISCIRINDISFFIQAGETTIIYFKNMTYKLTIKLHITKFVELLKNQKTITSQIELERAKECHFNPKGWNSDESAT